VRAFALRTGVSRGAIHELELRWDAGEHFAIRQTADRCGSHQSASAISDPGETRVRTALVFLIGAFPNSQKS
jgi:hypothetical protein